MHKPFKPNCIALALALSTLHRNERQSVLISSIECTIKNGCKAIVFTNQAFRMLLLLAERYDRFRRNDVNQPFGWHRDDELWGVVYEPTRRRLGDRDDECQKQKPTTTVLHRRLPFSPNTLCALIAPTYCSYMKPTKCCTVSSRVLHMSRHSQPAGPPLQ